MNSGTSQIAEHPSGHHPAYSIVEPIAIIGIGCRFPGGVNDPAGFWRLLRDGVDAISDVPATRWDADAFYASRAATPGKTVTRWGGFLEHVDLFDAAFFGITPREATYMDPQQRLLLEVAWEALENACQPVDRLAGTSTCVFIGISGSDYGLLQNLEPERIVQYSGIGSAVNIAAGRLSYLFDLRGPCVAVDTASSSSLVAVHLACQSLRSGESNLALAGGVKLMLSPSASIMYSQMHVLASDGRCKTFDSRADGFVPGEGCGVVVLKRLADALADGDPIQAVIRGSAINQDGRSSSLSAPNAESQQAVIRLALRRSGIDPASISYVETHGSGTPLGDPIEVGALSEVLGHCGDQVPPCMLGAVKTNIGHLDTAAGIAGLIKAVLALRHGALPGNLNFQTLNPQIALDGTRFVIPTALVPWPRDAAGRIAGVNSFGWSGTNAHVLLEEAPQSLRAAESRQPSHHEQPYVLPISARNPQALKELVRRYHSLLTDQTAPALHDIAYTASTRRTHHTYRLALIGASSEVLAEQAEAVLNDTSLSEPIGHFENPQLVFVFPGQGSQWMGMARDLFDSEPVFRTMIDACAAAFRPYITWDLHEQICNPTPDPPIDVIQPTLFAVTVGINALWQSWGIVPAAVVGHSMGEVAAAYAAGALSLDDAARITCIRSQLMRRCSGQGTMAVINLTEAEVEAALVGYQDRLSVAALNGPHTTVISGVPDAIEALMAALEQQQVFCRRVSVDIAAHSAHMDPLLDEVRAALVDLQPQPTDSLFYSSVTEGMLTGESLDAHYWARNLRAPVRFSPTVAALIDAGYRTFIEISPHPVLMQAVKGSLEAAGQTGIVLPSLRRHEDARTALLTTLGALYTAGYPVCWERLYPQRGRCVDVPAYPWQRERFWIEDMPAFRGRDAQLNDQQHAASERNRSNPSGASVAVAVANSGQMESPDTRPEQQANNQRDHLAECLYRLHWEPQARPAVSSQPLPNEQWLIFADESGVGRTMAAVLRARGAECVLVTPGAQGLEGQRDNYRIDPARPEAFRQLLQAISSGSGLSCRHVIFLWGLASANLDTAPMEDRLSAQRYGIMSALYLAQALARSGWRDMPRLWLVTRGTQAPADPSGTSPLLEHAALWGFGRTMMYEHPELHCSLLDVPAGGMANEAEALVEEFLARTTENQVAFRGAQRYVARLVHVTPDARQPKAPSQNTVLAPAGKRPFQLRIDCPGALDELTLHTIDRHVPGPGQVEIEVRATGLNFADVLRARGIYPGQEQGSPLLGLECAGIVSAIGAGVTGLTIGDAVVACTAGAFSSHVAVDARFVVPKPKQIDFATAATLPIAFMTAWHSLETLARLAPGERVLIHSAAGGVGLAAVQIARQIGADIFATAGTPEKRAFLHSLGIAHVLDSRSSYFASEILELTNGQGVDVVLNSLTGVAISTSLEALGMYGRFVELGKKDIYQHMPLDLGAFRKSLAFFAVDIPGMMTARPAYFARLLHEIMGRFAEGILQPSPLRSFPITQVREAFNLLAQHQHIGKIVVSIDAPEHVPVAAAFAPQSGAHSAGTYMVVGDLESIGLTSARWLVDEGVRHLALVRHRRLSPAAQAGIDEIAATGATIGVYHADPSSRAELAAVLSSINQSNYPLRGVLYMPDIPDTYTIAQLDPERIAATIAPHIQGAWNLHSLTLNLPLDRFVLCSSVAGMLGLTGQGSQAAVDTFFETLTYYRRSQGLAALNISWSPASDTSLAADAATYHPRTINQGLKSITSDQAVAALTQVSRLDALQVAVMPLNVRQWIQVHPAAATLPIFARLLQEQKQEAVAPPASSSLRDALLAAETEQRLPMLESHLKEQVCKILRLVPGKIDRHKPLGALGLDSLMALELRNRLEDSLALQLSVTLIWNYQTIAALSEHLTEKLSLPLEPPQTVVEPELVLDQDTALAMLLAEVDKYSFEELRQALSD
jgi:acyl transferase domain-containing protein/acyl carrier protein